MDENEQKKYLKDLGLPQQASATSISSTYLDHSEDDLPTEPGVPHVGFQISNEEFLLGMDFVREIIMLQHITFVPGTQQAIEGIIALRGEIMPVINLRRALNFEKCQGAPTTRIIIMDKEGYNFGIIVDDITEFTSLQGTDIEPIPQNFFSAEYKILSGVARLGEKVLGVVDVAKIIEMVQSLERKLEQAS